MTRIGYVIPGSALGGQEVSRRGKVANEIIGGTSIVDMIESATGPENIENSVEDAYAATSYFPQIKSVEDQYDAFVLGCFGDPGLRAARELIRTPIVGAAQSTLHFATQIADRYIIATPVRQLIPQQTELTRLYGLGDHLAGVVPVEVPINEIINDREGALKRITEIISPAISEYDGEAVILGCMSMGYHLFDEPLQEELGLPVLNPVKIALKTAELQATLKINHSERAYPRANLKKLAHLLKITT